MNYKSSKIRVKKFFLVKIGCGTVLYLGNFNDASGDFRTILSRINKTTII